MSIHRCATCDRKFLTKDGRGRVKKRWWLGSAVLISMALWYLGVALGFTGHTKVIWGAQKLVSGAQGGADRVKRDVGKALGEPSTAK